MISWSWCRTHTFWAVYVIFHSTRNADSNMTASAGLWIYCGHHTPLLLMLQGRILGIKNIFTPAIVEVVVDLSETVTHWLARTLPGSITSWPGKSERLQNFCEGKPLGRSLVQRFCTSARSYLVLNKAWCWPIFFPQKWNWQEILCCKEFTLLLNKGTPLSIVSVVRILAHKPGHVSIWKDIHA